MTVTSDHVPTTAKERAWLFKNWTPDDPTFVEWVGGSEQAHRLVPRVLLDLIRERRLVAELQTALRNISCARCAMPVGGYIESEHVGIVAAIYCADCIADD
jgi:hypothetical protein